VMCQHAAVCSASEASISGLVKGVVSITLTAFKAANALQTRTFSDCADCRAGPRRARKVTNGCRTSCDEGELGDSEIGPRTSTLYRRKTLLRIGDGPMANRTNCDESDAKGELDDSEF
jgi:hypothetical protein